MNKFKNKFPRMKPVIGMVHLPPLPGAPMYDPKFSWNSIIEFALEDAFCLIEGGVDGIQVENQFDNPYLLPENIGPETVAFVTSVSCAIRQKFPTIPLGVHIMLNGCIHSLAVAKAANADWIRAYNVANVYISNSGYISASGPELMRYRNAIDAKNIMVFGDFQVKHGSHAITADRSIEEKAHDAENSLTDAVIITGAATGVAPDAELLKRIKKHVSVPILIGSGLSIDNLGELLPFADGAIVGSTFKEKCKINLPVDFNSVSNFVKLAHSLN